MRLARLALGRLAHRVDVQVQEIGGDGQLRDPHVERHIVALTWACGVHEEGGLHEHQEQADITWQVKLDEHVPRHSARPRRERHSCHPHPDRTCEPLRGVIANGPIREARAVGAPKISHTDCESDAKEGIDGGHAHTERVRGSHLFGVFQSRDNRGVQQ